MIIHTSQLGELAQQIGDDSVALRLGTYDILHAGHFEGITRAASYADTLVVGVMPDDYAERRKGPTRPINSAEQRLTAIDRLEEVDYSFIAPSTVLGLARTLRSLRPDVYVEGAEHARPMAYAKRKFLHLLGVEYVITHHTYAVSSSQMLARFGTQGAIARSALTFSFASEDS